MSATPFLQLYVGDYLADTLDLTTEQHGAYLLLLMTMWRHDARLPNDPAKLARIARVSARRWHLVWDAISQFFYEDCTDIRNKRLEREHQKAVSLSKKRSVSGEAGGRAKALKNKDQALASATDLPKHSQKPEPEATLSSVAAAPERDDLFQKLIDALGEDKIQGHGAMDLSSIYGLIQAGVDLEIDILPTIRQRGARLSRPVKYWSYFAESIREAYQRRIGAGQGLPKPESIKITPDADRSPEWLEKAWPVRLERGRNYGEWSVEHYGPPPGQPGCRVPPEFIKQGDGLGWGGMRKAA